MLLACNTIVIYQFAALLKLIYTTPVLRPFFRDHPGEPIPEENFTLLKLIYTIQVTFVLCFLMARTVFYKNCYLTVMWPKITA